MSVKHCATCACFQAETKAECGWFGEGRGKCLLKEGHRDEHTCEHDGRQLRIAMLGLAAVSEAERRGAVKTSSPQCDVKCFDHPNCECGRGMP
jgi:hypothetical protein